jgi:hypothetical protein
MRWTRRQINYPPLLAEEFSKSDAFQVRSRKREEEDALLEDYSTKEVEN